MFEVAEETISHDSTQEISVFSPEAEGSWPVVHLFTHAFGDRVFVAELARTLAGQGVVVFAPDYRSTWPDGPGREGVSDLVCSWRFGNSVASQYGGDVEQSVTLVGWEHGANQALEFGLRGDATSEEQCFTAAPDPVAVVGIGPCISRVIGFDPSGWSNKGARVVLILPGRQHPYCPKSGAEYGAEQLQSAGFDAALTTIDGANQFSLILHKIPNELGNNAADYDPGNPAGIRVVQMVLDTIGEGS